MTASSSQSIFTGVQRIVRDFAESNQDDAIIVRFDPRTGVFRIVPRVPRLPYRMGVGSAGWLQVTVRNLYWTLSRGFREQGPRGRWIPRWVRKAARSFYEKYLRDSRLERDGDLQRRPPWVPQPHQTFALLDIPITSKHVEALSSLAESGEVRFVVYLHDLMPLSHRHLFNPASHPGVRARHMRYLDIIGEATDVVCNSHYTQDQYTRFTHLIERPSTQSVRVVYPPWPQFAHRTHGFRDSSTGAFGAAEVRVLAIGALNVRKNMKVLIASLKLMAAGDDVHLVIVSGVTPVIDPEFTANLLSLTDAEQSRVTILQAVSDARLLELYDQATVVAVPSLAEGFGLPVVESLSLGKPVVASNATALRELAGLLPLTLVSPTDAKEWAEAIVSTSRVGLAAPVVRPAAFPADWSEFRSLLLAKDGLPAEQIPHDVSRLVSGETG